MTEAATNTHSRPARVELRVVDGLHNGVSLPLTDGDHLIGSSTDADIVLHDEGVASRHVIICIEADYFRVEAIGGPLKVGNQLIEQGQGYRLRLPVKLTIGSASVRLQRPGESHSDERPFAQLERLTSAPALLTTSILGCAIVAVIIWQVLIPSLTTNSASFDSQLAIAAKSASTTASTRHNISKDANTVVKQLNEQLLAADIKTLNLTVENGLIRVTGPLSREKAQIWTDIQSWFDSTYAPDLALRANITIQSTSSTPVIRLQAIWYGENPYIIAGDGNRYYEGALIEDGWLVQKIGEDRLTLLKGGEEYSITYE